MTRLTKGALSRRGFLAVAGSALAVRPALAAERVVRVGVPRAFDDAGRPVEAEGMLGAATFSALSAALATHQARVEWRYFVNAGPDINEAFASGQIDLALYGDFPAVIARAAGIDIRLILPLTRGALESYLVVPVDSPAKTVQDLKGKRLAVNLGRPWTLAFSRLLRQSGLTLSDFQIVNLVMPEGDAAVSGHHVDGQVTLNGLALQARGTARILWSTAQAPLSWKFGTGLFASNAIIQQDPDLIQAIVTALISGSTFYARPENRDQYLRIAAATQNLPLELREESWKGKDIRVVLSPVFDDFITQHYHDVAQFARASHLISHDIDVSTMIDTYFSRKALLNARAENIWPILDADGNPLQKR